MEEKTMTNLQNSKTRKNQIRYQEERKKRSLGKHAMKMRIYIIEDLEEVKVRQTEKYDFFNNLLRTELLAIDSFFYFKAALLEMINSSYNQQPGDIVAQTVVIKESPT
jgi:hypothetical protein